MAHLVLVLTIMGSIIFFTLTILSIIHSDFVKHTFIHTLKGLNYYSALQKSYQEREQQEKQHLKTNDWLGHPLSEYDISFLKLYLQGISFMHPKFPAIMEGVAFHDLAESLGVSNIVFSEIQQETSLYDEIGRHEILVQLYKTSDAISISCFFCDFTRLFIEDDLNGNFSECWKKNVHDVSLNRNGLKVFGAVV